MTAIFADMDVDPLQPCMLCCTVLSIAFILFLVWLSYAAAGITREPDEESSEIPRKNPTK